MTKPGTFGGGERLAAEVTRRLDPERFERTLCMTRPPPQVDLEEGFREWAQGLRDDGVELLVLERRSRRDLAAWRPLFRRLRDQHVDVVHSHMFGTNVSAAPLARAAGVPVMVAHEHTWSYQGQPLRRFLDREVVARLSDAFVAVSREDRRRMIEVERIDPGDVVFIPNGIPAPPPRSGADKRTELGIEPTSPVVGAVGVLRPQKALDVMIRAAGVVRERFPDVRFLIVGPGRARPALEALIAELGLGATVRLLGARTDVPDLLGAFDVAACSSDFEGSPLSVMEYMEAARPIVATRVGGLPDLIDDGVHGLLVAPRDHAALAAAIERVLADPDQGARMGEAARERCRREFSIEVMVERIADLYEGIHARKREGRR